MQYKCFILAIIMRVVFLGCTLFPSPYQVSMAEVVPPILYQKHKFTFKFYIQSLKLTFTDVVAGANTTMPPVAITLAKGGHTITTDYAPLAKQGEHV